MSKTPLILDIDDTFLKTDLLHEAVWAGLGQAPWQTLKACARHFRAPAALKAALADIVTLRMDLLPVRPEIAEMAKTAKTDGQVVGLASASDERWVAGIAQAHKIEGPQFASNGETNLKGKTKAEVLQNTFGPGGYIYAGDSVTDIAVWESAQSAIVVGAPRGASQYLSQAGKDVTHIPGGWTPSDLLRALRPHQWVKNILLFLPLIAAHQFGLLSFAMVLLGIVAFSAAASAIYIVNDLLDLEADRLHATKNRRPFASGAVPIRVGTVASLVLMAVALGLGAVLGPAFLGVVSFYMLLSLAYSLKLKRMRWVDVATLATLYTLRVVAGAAASQVEASVMMLVFIFPVFIALGCVKRLTELTLATTDERLPGRGYGRQDRGDLRNVAWLGVIGALVVFFLYSTSEQAQALYPTRWILWVAMVPIAGWLVRMVVLGYRGKQDYDPIVFAMRDKMGIGILLITLAMMFYAAGLWAQWFGV